MRDRDVNRRPRLYTMSAIPPKADIGERDQDVRFVPNCDIDQPVRSPRPRVGEDLSGLRVQYP